MRREQNCVILVLNNFVMTFVSPGKCLNVNLIRTRCTLQNKKRTKSGEDIVNTVMEVSLVTLRPKTKPYNLTRLN